MKRKFTALEAREVGGRIGIDFKIIDLEQFRMGLSHELEHGSCDPLTNVTDDNLLLTGKIAWAHLNEIPDYYTRLRDMEKSAKSEIRSCHEEIVSIKR